MIAIYDSGIGGASVLIAVRAIAPHVDILYLADQAHVPYGDRSSADIRAIALDCADWLVAQGAVSGACSSETQRERVTYRACVIRKKHE